MARISWRGTLDLPAPRESAWHGARYGRRPRESIDSRPLERVRLWKQLLKVAIPKRAGADRAPNRGTPQVSRHSTPDDRAPRAASNHPWDGALRERETWRAGWGSD